MSANKRRSTRPPAPKSTRTAAAPRKRPSPPKNASFPIVGIGASAGGLEAFTQLLGALPVDTGLAFVLVQHLAPQHESMLAALLSFHDLLINVTSFFREPEAFEVLKKKVFPRLLKDRPPQTPIRVWVLVLFEEPAPAAAPPAPGTKSAKVPRATPASPGKLLTQLQQGLTATKEYLQSINGDHERTNEELQSANEEILSSNEELQSTNEELETAKDNFEVDAKFPGVGRKKLVLNARRIVDEDLKTQSILLAIKEAKMP